MMHHQVTYAMLRKKNIVKITRLYFNKIISLGFNKYMYVYIYVNNIYI